MIDYLLSLSNKEWHKTIYYYSSFISIFLIIIAYTGIIYINPNYIRRLHTFLLFYVCAILLIRFNPYAKGGHSDFDKKIAFTAGIILLTSVVATHITDYVIPGSELIEDILTI
jgi:hypothetical protein